MSAFVSDLGQLAFLQNALLVGLLASVACGIVAASSWCGASRTWPADSPLRPGRHGRGALAERGPRVGVADPHPRRPGRGPGAALVMGLVSLYAKEREDTVMSALWAVGMAVGILFIARTPGYGEDLMNYLFGNILMVSPGDLWLIAVLDAAVVVLALACYDQLVAVCFDEEFARLRGLPWSLLPAPAVPHRDHGRPAGDRGRIVLVIALLTLPAAVAGYFTGSLWRMMLWATALCALFTTSGLALSYAPTSPPARRPSSWPAAPTWSSPLASWPGGAAA